MRTLFVLAAIAATAFATSLNSSTVSHDETPVAENATSQPASVIEYNMGAKVLTDPLRIFFIYYGNWTAPKKSILEDFTTGVDQSSWWAITKKYYFQKNNKSPKVYVDGTLKLAKTVVDNYSQGTFLNDTSLISIIQDQIDNKKLPETSKAIYFVLTSDDVDHIMLPPRPRRRFNKGYCGLHNATTLASGKRIYYSFVGNPSLNGLCISWLNYAISPNNDVTMDAMVMNFAFELIATIISPERIDRPAWMETNNELDANLCLLDHGKTMIAENGAEYNLAIKDRKYLVQQNYDPIKQTCAMSP